MCVKILKSVIDVILIPLTNLINLSIDNSVFPDCLKLARGIPIFKKGNSNDPANYRPISLLPVFIKVFEKLIYRQLADYFESHNIFHPSQYGFRSNRSTTLAITKLCGDVGVAFEQGHHVDASFYDLTKAFDCLSHDVLTQKLVRYGLDNKSIRLLSTYLQGRVQFVDSGGSLSTVSSLSKGVPQGSVLGPLLFLVSVNDLPNSINSKVILFADDTTTYSSGADLHRLSDNSTLTTSTLHEWFTANQLSLNVDKTQSLLFSLRPHSFEQGPSSFSASCLTLV